MRKKKQYITSGVLLLLSVVLCICLTMCHGEETDNKSDKKGDGQTEIILDSDNVQDESEDSNSTGNIDENDPMSDSENTNTDQKNQSDKTTDKQKPTLNGKDNPSDDNSYDFEDVWGDGSETSSGSGNEDNTDASEEAEDSQDEEMLDNGAQDDKNSGYGPLI